ncbi:MAG: DUF4810 domain-containing protein [Proteiniphilum sp.]|nr:DUF4810 domain-containing protein [Proteiniphilum sp.]MDD3910517.1 DUF4810 domain-containing protein [Proteiniphilum sp.]MDD4417162.1 DUF4810 domain-containing protein [Proteiniphilum sp.]
MKLILLFLSAMILFGCAQNKDLYHYGDVSYRYYKAIKLADEKSVSDYKASLESVFEKSAQKGLKVPPGLYIDYAMLLIKEYRYEEARAYLAKEAEIWPESIVTVHLLEQRYGLNR